MGFLGKAKQWARKEFMPTEKERIENEEKEIASYNRRAKIIRAKNALSREEYRGQKLQRQREKLYDMGDPSFILGETPKKGKNSDWFFR